MLISCDITKLNVYILNSVWEYLKSVLLNTCCILTLNICKKFLIFFHEANYFKHAKHFY